MAKKPIEQMNYEELRTEVKLMSDEMARMKRTYEDLLYNLDMSNFTGQFVKEVDGVESSINQTADEIRAEVRAREEGDKGLTSKISTVAQTAEAIKAEVQTVKNGVATNKASIEVNAEAIKKKVEQTDIDKAVTDLATVTQTAEAVQSMVAKRFDMKNAIKILQEYDNDGQAISAEDLIAEAISGNDEYTTKNVFCIYKSGANASGEDIVIEECFYYYNETLECWTELDSDSIYTVFEQTADGFVMRGNVVIDGSLVVGLAKVSETLHIGDIEDVSDKEIVFCDMARIRCVQAGMDISISGRELYIATESLNLSNCKINWGENQPVCVFGTEE